MEHLGLNFHHLGLAVRDRNAAEKFVKSLGYSVSETIFDPLQKVYLSMATCQGQPAIEIISSDDDSGPLGPILKDTNESIYHICYYTDSVAEFLQRVKQAGFRAFPVSEAKPAILFQEQPVSFFYITGFGLIEVLEKPHSN
ncbi:MAG: VOC family protein [Desulfovibrio sp.]